MEVPAQTNNDAKIEDEQVGKRVKLAVFDFDGTSIEGNSPVLLVFYLAKRNMLRKRVLIRIIAWALAYKFRLPQNESWVRGLVFRAFRDKPKEEVDEFLYEFYDTVVDKRFRPKAEEAMIARGAEGCEVVVVSATFEPIVKRAMEKHPFMYQISTRMCVDAEDHYTCEVEGEPIEGSEKIHAVTQFANEKYGEQGWYLAYAYGDHHSDRTLLQAAKEAFAVTPDKPLRRTAHQEGWPILDWTYKH